jgi:hypothetical protein
MTPDPHIPRDTARRARLAPLPDHGNSIARSSQGHVTVCVSAQKYSIAPPPRADNEFIVDGKHWDDHLSDAVEAFMSGDGVEKVHADFLGKFGKSAQGVDGVPLLTMTPDIHAPFIVGKTYASEGDPTRLG